MRIIKVFLIASLVLVLAVLSVRFLSGPEDSWLCQNGEWVKHGNPSALKPSGSCGEPKQEDKSALIVVDSPLPNNIVASPILISGQARGTWFFEASFPVELVLNGQTLAQGIAQAKSDWMTEEFVPFEALLSFKFPPILCIAYPCTLPATLVLKKDNPSGLPEYDDQLEIAIKISEETIVAECKPSGCSGQICTDKELVTTCEYSPEYDCYRNAECKRQSDGLCGWTESPELIQCLKPFRTEVKAFFNNSNLDPQISCNKVFPVERQIAKTEAIARAGLEELLKGPSDEEKSRGYFTNINPGVKIQKLTIEDGTARVDFDEAMEKGMGGSCRVSAIRAEITETLKQFSTVKEVVISVDGRTEDILQP